MVAQSEIKAANALINDTNAPRVSVFVGGTSGIGKLTITALVGTGASVRIYLVGRKSAEARTKSFIQELGAVNPKAEVIWTEGEISLLAETKRVCELIKAREPRGIDLLVLTAGYAPFGARQETSEGIEVTQSLEYYSRVLFIQHLLPLLNKADAPRVVTVLGGGLERTGGVQLDDLDLKRSENFTLMKIQGHYLTMTTTTLDKLAEDHPQVTFVHSWPGWVNTGNVNRGIDEPNSIKAWLIWLFLEPLIRLIAISDEDSGQRHLFQGTNAYFGGRGISWQGKPGVDASLKQGSNGLFLVNYKCDCTPNAKVIVKLRETARVRIWEHTQDTLRPYL